MPKTLPELAYIMMLLGTFLSVFLLGHLTARGAGYTE